MAGIISDTLWPILHHNTHIMCSQPLYECEFT